MNRSRGSHKLSLVVGGELSVLEEVSKRPVWSSGLKWEEFLSHVGVSNGRVESSARVSGLPWLELRSVLSLSEEELLVGSWESEVWHGVKIAESRSELLLTTLLSDKSKGGDKSSIEYLLEYHHGYVKRSKIEYKDELSGLLLESELDLG